MNGIFNKTWDNTANPKAVVLLVHGLGEHCLRYEALANHFNLHGYIVCSMDLPSHGQSEGTKGHIDQFSDYTDCVLERYQQLHTSYPDLPVFLLGHSMGGLIATSLLLDHQHLFAGALLSGAAIQSPQKPPAWQVMLIRLMAKIAPRLEVLELDASGISHDKKVVQAYNNDPLVHHGKLTARFLVEMNQAMQICCSRAAEISLPINIMHGGADVMTSPEGSQFLYQQVSSQDKTINIYPDLFHEIFNEPKAHTIYGQMTDWLDQRL